MVILWCVLVLLLAAATENKAQCSEDTSGVEFTSVSTTTSGVSSPYFLFGYQKISGFGEYKIHDSPMNWALANRTCVDERAHLVVMETEEEMDAVNEMIRSAGPSFALYILWTGVYRDNSSSPWITVLGHPLGSSAVWWPGNTSQFGDCVKFGSAVSTRGDISEECESKEVFLCEKQ